VDSSHVTELSKWLDYFSYSLKNALNSEMQRKLKSS